MYSVVLFKFHHSPLNFPFLCDVTQGLGCELPFKYLRLDVFSRVGNKNARSLMKSDCLGEWSQVRRTVVGGFDNLCRNHHQR